MNPEARKETSRDRERFQDCRKDLWTEAAIVHMSMSLAQPRVYKGQEQYRRGHRDPLTGTVTTLGTALTERMTERMNLTGSAMGLSGASRLTVGC